MKSEIATLLKRHILAKYPLPKPQIVPKKRAVVLALLPPTLEAHREFLNRLYTAIIKEGISCAILKGETISKEAIKMHRGSVWIVDEKNLSALAYLKEQETIILLEPIDAYLENPYKKNHLWSALQKSLPK